MASVNVLISVRSDYLKNILELVKKLQDVGMTNIQTMESVGIINGALDESQVSSLSTLEGVEHVERASTFQILPPDSPLQ